MVLSLIVRLMIFQCILTVLRTLQELIAPKTLEFYTHGGQLIGTRDQLGPFIADITSIPVEALSGKRPLIEFDVEAKLSWAANRSTQREEDSAYSLLGIFGIFMTPIYGEQKEDAMKRLIRAVKAVEDEAKKNLLLSLRFDQMTSRRANIKDAHRKTCQWLLNQPEYAHWLNLDRMGDHRGLLWIKGNPGAGKSTIMKFAHDQALETHSSGSVSPNRTTIIAFFFNASGAAIEKSTVGMYRSLLVQLLEHPSYMAEVRRLFPFAEVLPSGSYHWTLGHLQSLFLKVILTVKTPVKCYIDAMDECQEDEIRALVAVLRDLGDRASSSKSEGMEYVSTNTGQKFVRSSNSRLARCCANYIAKSTVAQTHEAKTPRSSQNGKVQSMFVLSNDRYPFHLYAIRNLPYHAAKVQKPRVNVQFQDLRYFEQNSNDAYLPTQDRIYRSLDSIHDLKEHTAGMGTAFLTFYIADDFHIYCLATLTSIGAHWTRIFTDEWNFSNSTLHDPDFESLQDYGPWGYIFNSLDAPGHSSLAKIRCSSSVPEQYNLCPLTWTVETRSATLQEQPNATLNFNDSFTRFGNVLVVAAVNDSADKAKVFLDCGADPNFQGGHYGNALQAAVVTGSERMVKLLLEHEADVNARGGSYDNALYAAAYNGNTSIGNGIWSRYSRSLLHEVGWNESPADSCILSMGLFWAS